MTFPITEYLKELHARVAEIRAGEVSTYISESARADKRHFGICLATIDGQDYEVGNTRHPFTILSIFQPFAYSC